MSNKDKYIAVGTILVLVCLLVYYVFIKTPINQSAECPTKPPGGETDSLMLALSATETQIELYQDSLEILSNNSIGRRRYQQLRDSIDTYRNKILNLTGQISSINTQFRKQLIQKDNTIRDKDKQLSQQNTIIATLRADTINLHASLVKVNQTIDNRDRELTAWFINYRTYSNGISDPDRKLVITDKARSVIEIEFTYSFSRNITSDDILFLSIEGIPQVELRTPSNRRQTSATALLDVERGTFSKEKTYHVKLYLTNTNYGITRREIGKFSFNFVR